VIQEKKGEGESAYEDDLFELSQTGRGAGLFPAFVASKNREEGMELK